MAGVKNSLVAKDTQETFSAFLNKDTVKNKINQMVGGKNGTRFISSIISAVATNPALATCEHSTILSAALLGEGLNLSPSPQLGQFYMLPFNDNKHDRVVATFVMGYKGYLQLAMRSGYYKKINVLPIKEGELQGFDPLEEVVTVILIEDEEVREMTPTVGYYAMFEYLNGFKKAIYWSKKKMLAHADRYAPAFSKDAVTVGKKKQYRKVSFADYEAGKYPPGDAWLYSSFWYKDFDGMAMKTMLRQLISKWGIMSIELQTAFERDDAVLHDDGSFEYVDNTPDDAQTIDITPTPKKEAEQEIEAQPAEDDGLVDMFFDDEAGA